jgi:hypothetical protein
MTETLDEVIHVLKFWQTQNITLDELIEMLESDPYYVFPNSGVADKSEPIPST